MNLTALSGGAFALGLAALAFGLYLLQRIRVRHQEVVVVTTLFWREALEESRARTLVERFRHPFAYAVALLLATLLWWSVAGPTTVRDRGRQHVLLLDASAAMAAPGRFAAAVEALERELEFAPRDRTSVLWCGADVHELLAPGEDRALLRPRLAGRAPDAAPASIERALAARLLAREADRKGLVDDQDLPLRAVVFGDAPVRESFLSACRTDAGEGRFDLQRAGLPAPRETVGSGITALGVAPAASGAWSTVDVLVEVRGTGAAEAELTFALRGAASVGSTGGVPPTGGEGDAFALPSAERRVVGPRHTTFLLRDVPAAGELFEARLARAVPGDPIAADDVAAVRLPDRPPIRVHLAADVADAVGASAHGALALALATDPAVVVADAADADVVIAAAPDGARPTLALVPADSQHEAVLVGHRVELRSEDVLTAALGELGLARLDAGRLAAELGRPVAVGAAPAEAGAPYIGLWRELVRSESTGFVEDRAFPLLIGRAVRWLAGADSVQPYAAVARTLPRRVGAAPGMKAGADAGGLAAHVVRLDTAASAPDAWGLALLDLDATAPDGAAELGSAAAPAALAPSQAEGPGPWRPATWILLLALALCGAEWALFQRGRMP